MIKYLLFSLFIISTIRCDYQDSLNEDDLVFIGSWSSEEYYLEIAANGYGFCQHRNRETIDGWVEITRNEIKFRDDFDRRDFDIDEYPFLEFGEVMMILDGDIFYRH